MTIEIEIEVLRSLVSYIGGISLIKGRGLTKAKSFVGWGSLDRDALNVRIYMLDIRY